ncbi:MAG TPA: hypothetical protein VF690_03245 [Hymenobacter sp.]|jgi:hypothetical protein
MENQKLYTCLKMAQAVRQQRQKAQKSHKAYISAGTMQSWESAEVLGALDAAAGLLEQLAKLGPVAHQIFGLVLQIPTGPPDATRYATVEQVATIQELLKNPVISKPERSKMLLNLHKLEEDRAEQAITNLRQSIADRTDKPAPAGHPALASDGYNQAYDAYNALLNDEEVTDEERRKARIGIGNYNEALLRLKTTKLTELIADRENQRVSTAA